jgi:hypothetical protein
MQNRRWLVTFVDWQQMRKSAFDLCVEPELDDPNGSLLLGNSLQLDMRLAASPGMPISAFIIIVPQTKT